MDLSADIFNLFNELKNIVKITNHDFCSVYFPDRFSCIINLFTFNKTEERKEGYGGGGVEWKL